jgi:CheY-like chemotaxis protein
VTAQRLSALVVDDDPAHGEHAGNALAAAGFSVRLATGAAQALTAPAGQRPDLVVCDQTFSDLDGPTLVRALRARGLAATYIATTLAPSAEVRQQWRAAGAAVCLRKPVDVSVLVAIAAQLLTDGHLSDLRNDPFDADLLDIMRARYLALLPSRAAAVRDTGELRELARVSGLLAGASAQFGYPGLGALCRMVERTARSGERDPDLAEVVLAAANHIQRTSR